MRLRLLMGLVPLSLIIAGCGAGGSASGGSPTTSVTTSVSPAATASRTGTAATTSTPAVSATSVQAATVPISGHCSPPATASTASGISGMQFTSRDRGWAVGSNSILATTDGGAHWSSLPEPCLTIRSAHFISPTAGFAVAGATGVVLVTVDGGRSWRELPTAPAGVQSVCYSDARHGWLGAGGVLYRTADGGATWTALTKAVAEDGAGYSAVMDVECANDGTVWALSSGPGAGMSQQQHVGYYGSQSGVTGLFAEQTMQAPGTGPTRESPGSDPGPFLAIDSAEAVYIDACTACGMGTAPWDLVSGSGATLTTKGNVADITSPEAASFLSAQVGWVAGTAAEYSGTFRSQQRIMATTNGGRTWVLQWAGPWTSS